MLLVLQGLVRSLRLCRTFRPSIEVRRSRELWKMGIAYCYHNDLGVHKPFRPIPRAAEEDLEDCERYQPWHHFECGPTVRDRIQAS